MYVVFVDMNYYPYVDGEYATEREALEAGEQCKTTYADRVYVAKIVKVHVRNNPKDRWE